MKQKCTVGGLVKHKDGYGFKLSFTTPEKAQHYKDMFVWIIKDDHIGMVVERGYYDMEDMKR